MKHFVLYDNDGTRQKLRVKGLFYNPAARNDAMPFCAWCTRAQVKPIFDIIQQGFFHDHYRTLCMCPDCQEVTCLIYDIPLVEVVHEAG